MPTAGLAVFQSQDYKLSCRVYEADKHESLHWVKSSVTPLCNTPDETLPGDMFWFPRPTFPVPGTH